MIFMTGPLRQIIVDIDNPHTIKDMACWFEFRWNFGCTPKIKKRWKRKPHIASFIGNEGATKSTTDFAWKNSLVFMEFISDFPTLPSIIIQTVR
jgi:hypothetical protein